MDLHRMISMANSSSTSKPFLLRFYEGSRVYRPQIQLFQMDASDVPGHLEAGSYTRIEVSKRWDILLLNTTS